MRPSVEGKWQGTAGVHPLAAAPLYRAVRSDREIMEVGEIPLAGARRVVQLVVFNAP